MSVSRHNDPGVDRDVLITRIIDGEATPEDWTAFKALAARDASVWGDLAEAQQDQAELSTAFGGVLAVADRVEAPVGEVYSERLSVRLRAAVGWGGWLAAGGVLLAWTLGAGGPLGPSNAPVVQGLTPSQEAALIRRPQTPDQALDLYLDAGRAEGRVIAEMPTKVLLEARPNPDGAGFEVLYYRQILERAVVPELRSVEGLGRAMDDGAM
ncbi:MAG: hypothetical protein EA378_06395 [Phycisphaerales bacterium]|nr:MAG: hypothetical protein EA378_06395 [Phycisphaerales bacterium]